jgi:prepilin-type processing-associated H-X9-DG protein
MQSFALDHRGRYPMQVPDEDEGSSGGNSEHLAIHTNLSFSTRHFNAIARELGSPKVLACPSDNRRAANSFSGLGLENISYWLNIQARAGSSLDYLGGDRNLSRSDKGNSSTNQGMILTFTKAIHGYRGNILFADGRVELLRSIEIQPTPVQEVSENPSPRDGAGTVLPSDSHTTTGRNPILAISDLLDNSRRKITNSGASEIRPRPGVNAPSPDKSATDREASRSTEVYPIVPSAMQKSGGARPQAGDSASRPRGPRDLTQPGMDHASEDAPRGTLMELLLTRRLGIWLFILGLILVLLALVWHYLHRKRRGQALPNSN